MRLEQDRKGWKVLRCERHQYVTSTFKFQVPRELKQPWKPTFCWDRRPLDFFISLKRMYKKWLSFQVTKSMYQKKNNILCGCHTHTDKKDPTVMEKIESKDQSNSTKISLGLSASWRWMFQRVTPQPHKTLPLFSNDFQPQSHNT